MLAEVLDPWSVQQVLSGRKGSVKGNSGVGVKDGLLEGLSGTGRGGNGRERLEERRRRLEEIKHKVESEIEDMKREHDTRTEGLRRKAAAGAVGGRLRGSLV